MAFGLGFNKAKVLSDGEKYVAQGKIPAAIEEYRKILDRDPKDLMVLNTVADLYVRAGKNEEAIKRFYELAEKCVEGGLLPRAIAVYKRITKISPDAVQSLLRLGELYSMQGLLRDSRAHYQQAVEHYLQRKDKDKAREVFEKVLMLDMENPQLQVRMAELYLETGKKPEAITTYMGAVERFLDKNQAAEADEALRVLLRLDPQNPDSRTLLGRVQLERGEFGKAAETLQGIPSLASQKGALNLLFHAYTRLGDAAKAKEIATQLFDRHEDFAGLAQISEDCISRRELDAALEIYEAASARLVAQRASSCLVDGLRKILASQPSHVGALQLMSKVYQDTGNLGEARETTELLAHAYVAQGELKKARQIYSELAAMEPENPDHLRLLRKVEQQMGAGRKAEEAPPEADAPVAMVAELGTSPEQQAVRDEALPPFEEQLVRNSLTESDLYITYHQTGRAIETLENGLTQLPGNITLNEHLLPLYEQSQDFRKAAAVCEALTEAYVKLGDGERASRYGELTLSYQQRGQGAASAAAEAGPPASLAKPAEAPLAAGTGPAGTAGVKDISPTAPASLEDQSQVREVDLSMEWATVSGAEEASAAADDSAVEEIEFYIEAGLLSEARAAIEHLQKRSPSHPAIARFQERLDLAKFGVAPAAKPVPAEKTPAVDLVQPSAGEMPAAKSLPVAESGELEPVAAGPEAKSAPPAISTEKEAPEAEPEWALEEVLPAKQPGSVFELSLEEAEVQSQQAAAAAAAPQSTLGKPASAPAPPQNAFATLAQELEGEFTLPEQPPSSPPATPLAPGPQDSAAAPGTQRMGNVLEDVFAEFKAEMEEPVAGEDLETHYNMGVAFKEMALYDEAIGEFQKVHQLAAKTNDSSHIVQCCSLLATCFLEKGLPQLAVKWYQTALDSPGLDPESALALRYEMASAYDTAGDRQAALRGFLEVYARNIDYRDVAERIRSLQQAQ